MNAEDLEPGDLLGFVEGGFALVLYVDDDDLYLVDRPQVEIIYLHNGEVIKQYEALASCVSWVGEMVVRNGVVIWKDQRLFDEYEDRQRRARA